jgi:hypothetical protein
VTNLKYLEETITNQNYKLRKKLRAERIRGMRSTSQTLIVYRILVAEPEGEVKMR